MDRIDFVLPGDLDDGRDVQIGPNRLARLADQVGFVGFEAMQGVAVFVRIDGHRANAQFVGGAKHPNGDFAAIGDEQFADWWASAAYPRTRNENSTHSGPKCNIAL